MNIHEYLKSGTELAWTVDQFIGQGHNCLLFGREGSGKSWFASFIAKAVASGSPLVGRFETNKGRCLILDEDTQECDQRFRLSAVFSEDDDVEVNPFDGERGFNLTRSSWISRLEAKLEVIQPDLMVIDSLTAIRGELKETSNDDMSKLRSIFGGFRRASGRPLTIILVHHEGKDEAKGARGAVDLMAMADTVLRIGRFQQDPLQFIVQPIARKRQVVKPFVVELAQQEDKASLVFLGEIEVGIGLPTEEAIDVVMCFVLKPGMKTVEDLFERDLEKKYSPNIIRNELKNLVGAGILSKEVGAHNLGKYSLNNDWEDANLFSRVVSKELAKKCVPMRPE